MMQFPVGRMTVMTGIGGVLVVVLGVGSGWSGTSLTWSEISWRGAWIMTAASSGTIVWLIWRSIWRCSLLRFWLEAFLFLRNFPNSFITFIFNMSFAFGFCILAIGAWVWLLSMSCPVILEPEAPCRGSWGWALKVGWPRSVTYPWTK